MDLYSWSIRYTVEIFLIFYRYSLSCTGTQIKFEIFLDQALQHVCMQCFKLSALCFAVVEQKVFFASKVAGISVANTIIVYR